MIDARSDLDCSGSLTSVHIVASSLSPVGAVLHTFGLGTAYNPFVRELGNMTFGPSPSIAQEGDDHFELGMATASLFDINSSIPQGTDAYHDSDRSISFQS